MIVTGYIVVSNPCDAPDWFVEDIRWRCRWSRLLVVSISKPSRYSDFGEHTRQGSRLSGGDGVGHSGEAEDAGGVLCKGEGRESGRDEGLEHVDCRNVVERLRD